MTQVDKDITIVEEIHRACPQSYTTENLAKWITDNHKEKRIHTKKIPLTEEEISEYEHKSSIASRAIDRLNSVKEKFMTFLNDGTPVDTSIEYVEGDEPKLMPVDVTIPPTKGLKALKANREYADSILEKGYNEENTELFIIPFPDEQFMVCLDIRGFEWKNYTRIMTDSERTMYGKLFIKDEDGEMQAVPVKDIDPNFGGANIKIPKKGNKKTKEADDLDL